MSSQYVKVGRVIKTHGTCGRIRIHLDNPESMELEPASRLYFGRDPENLLTAAVLSVKPVHMGILVSLETILTKEAAATFLNLPVWVPAVTLRPPGRDTYYHFQLKGMSVSTTDGRYLGILEDVIKTGANDVYLVRSGSREYLIPAILSVVREVDVASKTMTIEDMPNMLDQE